MDIAELLRILGGLSGIAIIAALSVRLKKHLKKMSS